MDNLRLIVGLGNPGTRYTRTRHNVGFQLAGRLAQGWHASWKAEKRFQAELARTERGKATVLLCRPQTFMNSSGEAVQAVAAYYRVPPGALVVAVDDADLPLGEIRLRGSGSSGGHHGLESIEQHLGTREFARLRIGIGRTADGRREITDYVLAPFSADEAALLDDVLAAAAAQVQCWLDAGIGKAMSQFNGVVGGPGQERKTE
jgi:PTH1 family peptidyl-tRNA hydrolase